MIMFWVLIYVLSVLVFTGFMNAYYRGSFPTLNSVVDRKGDFAFSLGFSLIPLWWILIPFATAFFHYGWTLNYKPLRTEN